MKNILVVGIGKIGIRHLQALTNIQFDAKIILVDTRKSALDEAKKFISKLPASIYQINYEFHNDLDNLRQNHFDLGILSVNADIRRDLINKILNDYSVSNLILEKFLFQRKKYYSEIDQLLKSKKVNAWVNCPRREWEFYQKLKNLLKDDKIISVDIFGTKWGLATSSIHFIDIIAYLIDDYDYEIINLDFHKTVSTSYSTFSESTRTGYFEIFGSMRGKFSSGTYFNFICENDKEIPFKISLSTLNRTLIIYEEKNSSVIINEIDEEVIIKKQKFTVEYQSMLTDKIANNIIFNNYSCLTKYDNSVKLHLPLFDAFLKYSNTVNKNNKKTLLIT